ncbi:MAG: BadF/BadG/BcrA/BcrD ATPase family protein [Patescibacteria group bacterium]
MFYYLGIDGGGSSTTSAIADEKGNVVGTGEAGPSLYKVVGMKVAMGNIQKAICDAERTSRRHISSYTSAVFGLSGVDSMQDWQVLSREIFRHFKKKTGDRFRVVNDVVIALAAGTDEPFGAAVIAGTGSNAYAAGPKGEAYAGGLGSLLSDEGSAYAIGVDTLRAAVKSFDGRGRRTLLESLVRRRMGVRHMRHAVDVVYSPSFDKTMVAGIAPLCVRAAQRGDAVARGIITHAASELSLMACAVIRKVGLASRVFDLVLWGGVFGAGNMLLRSFNKSVLLIAPHARIKLLHQSPCRGALRIAREELSIRE